MPVTRLVGESRLRSSLMRTDAEGAVRAKVWQHHRGCRYSWSSVQKVAPPTTQMMTCTRMVMNCSKRRTRPQDEGDGSRCVCPRLAVKHSVPFCATGRQGFRRNLTSDEIVNQVLSMEDVFGRRATNVVMMGMGEPLP